MVHNPVAKALRTSSCRPRVIKAKKGKGSYKREKITHGNH